MTTRDELAQNPALQDELRRMQRGEPYDAHTPEMYAWRDEVKKLLRRLNITEYHEPTMRDIIHELLPNAAPDIYVEPPFEYKIKVKYRSCNKREKSERKFKTGR